MTDGLRYAACRLQMKIKLSQADNPLAVRAKEVIESHRALTSDGSPQKLTWSWKFVNCLRSQYTNGCGSVSKSSAMLTCLL